MKKYEKSYPQLSHFFMSILFDGMGWIW